jgi:hypothetical protein
MATDSLAKVWLDTFGEEPAHPRQLTEQCFSNPTLFGRLITAIPECRDQPSPGKIASYLKQRENLLFTLDDNTYRFARVGHRWRISQVPDNIVAAA